MSNFYKGYVRKRSWTLTRTIKVYKYCLAIFTESKNQKSIEFFTEHLEMCEAAYLVALAREKRNGTVQK